MGHRFPRGANTRDPGLVTREYVRNRKRLRAQAAAVGAPCARCGRAIDYQAPYWVTTLGKRSINPRAFVAGHRVARAQGGTHDLANLQPECAACSIRSGARLGRQRQGMRSRTTRAEQDVTPRSVAASGPTLVVNDW